MIVPAAERLRMLHSRVADGGALARAVSDPAWIAGAKALKSERGSSVLRGRVGAAGTGGEALVVVKTLALSRGKDFFSRLFSVTRGLRQWRGGELLARRGFATGEQLALFRGIGPDGAIHESIVIRWVEGRSLYEHIAARDLSAKQEAALAQAAGDLARRMVEAGVFNRDNKPSNIVAQWTNAGEPSLALIDPVGVRAIEPWAGRRKRARMLEWMLASLVIEPRRVGHPRALSLRLRAIEATISRRDHDGIHERWRNVERLVAEHRAKRDVVKAKAAREEFTAEAPPGRTQRRIGTGHE
jgi:hypothetical protein